MSRESQYTHFEDKIQDQISIVSTVSTVKLAHFWVNFQFFYQKWGSCTFGDICPILSTYRSNLSKNIAQGCSAPLHSVRGPRNDICFLKAMTNIFHILISKVYFSKVYFFKVHPAYFFLICLFFFSSFFRTFPICMKHCCLMP